MFGVTGHLSGESTDDRLISLTKAVTRNVYVSFDLSLNKRLSIHRDAGDLRHHRIYHDVTVMIDDNVETFQAQFFFYKMAVSYFIHSQLTVRQQLFH